MIPFQGTAGVSHCRVEKVSRTSVMFQSTWRENEYAIFKFTRTAGEPIESLKTARSANRLSGVFLKQQLSLT